jgi:pSer/pThr/pTyr-binding forkhead associated (FHA) protein
MRLNLVVSSAGKLQGKAIPIDISQFLIGRDVRCHLRPASALISNRHCALFRREEQVFVRDLNSTNGTFVNGEKLAGEIELQNGDCLRIGPIAFEVKIEALAAVDQPTPFPPVKKLVETADDAAAAVLLSVTEGEAPATAQSGIDTTGVPTGGTVTSSMEVLLAEAAAAQDAKSGGAARHDQAKKESADTSVAAKAILSKYFRRGQ